MTYTFPFDTCEIPYHHSKYIAQPYSATINGITAIIVLIAFFMARDPYVRAVLAALFLFEAFHTLSHLTHLPGTLQTTLIHGIAYGFNACFLAMLVHFTGVLNPILLIGAVGIVAADIYFLSRRIFFGYFMTQIVLFLWISAFYIAFLKTTIPPPVLWMFALLILCLIALFANEIQHCKRMLNHHPFPYHAVIELIGSAIFLMYIWILRRIESR